MFKADVKHSEIDELKRHYVSFTHLPAVATVLSIYLLSVAVFLLLPTLLGALFSDYGFSEGQLGQFATVELVSIGLAAGTGVFWANHWNWRTVLYAGLFITLIGNMATYFYLGEIPFPAIIFLRFAVGLGGGVLAAVSLSFISHHPATEKVYGVMTLLTIVVMVAGLYFLPMLITLSFAGGVFLGAKGILLLLSLFTVILVAMVHLVPTGPSHEVQVQEDVAFKQINKIPAILILISFVFYMATQTAIWGFVEMLGTDAGLTPEEANLAATLSVFGGALGALLSIFMGDKFGRAIPLALAAILQLIALSSLVLIQVDYLIYVVLLSLFQVGWNWAVPYHIGLMEVIDPSRRTVPLISTAQATGLALGPILGGYAIEFFGYTAMLIGGIFLFSTYCALILPKARAAELKYREV